MRPVFALSAAVAASSTLSAAELVVPSGSYPTIQSAIAAAVHGDEVRVLPGTYFEQIDFLGKRITVYGQDGAGATVIDGSLGSGPVVTFATAERPKSVLTGFTITGGSGGSAGGGIFCSGSSPTLRDLVIDGNSAVDGGGIYIVGGFNGPPHVEGCDFYTNTCTNFGANIYVDGEADFRYCNVYGEFGVPSGAVAGGGAYLTGSTAADPARVVRCLFLDNTASAQGAGVYSDGGRLDLSHSILVGNATPGGGGGVYVGGTASGTVADIWNCAIADNHGDSRGGGVACEAAGTTLIRSCSFAINGSTGGATGFGGGAYVGSGTLTITNTILYFDVTPAGPELAVVPLAGAAPVMNVSWSDVEGGQAGVLVSGAGTLNWLAGNIDADPLYNFGSALRLMTGSPCIDMANPSYVATPLERECPNIDTLALRDEGERRVDDPSAVVRLDMGADEYWDCNGNGIPDYQESFPDCNANGLIDACEIAQGLATDLDANGTPDDCQVIGAEICFTGVPNAPCGNYDAGAGAQNRASIGTTMNAVGGTSIVANSMTFVVRDAPPGVPAVFFSGETAVNVFQDNGVRCAGAPIKRHQVVSTSPFGLATFTPNLSTIGWSAGEMRVMQLWYRDNEGSCDLSLNFSNALQFTLTP